MVQQGMLSIILLMTVVYSQPHQCRDTNNGPVAKGVDFVDIWSKYEQTKTVPMPTIGDSQYIETYNGYQFYFKNATNANTFKQNPIKYVPQYGCYCGWAMSGHDTACANPPGYCLGPLCYNDYTGYAFLEYNGVTRLYCFFKKHVF